jgi:hypothetical protein
MSGQQTRFEVAQDAATVVELLESAGLLTGPDGRRFERVLLEFAADCLDAVDDGGRYRYASDLARRAARGKASAEQLREARGFPSPSAALGALNNYHSPSAALAFLANGVLSDSASDAAKTAARMASLYRGFTLLQGLEGNPLKGQEGSRAARRWGGRGALLRDATRSRRRPRLRAPRASWQWTW